MKGQHRPIGMLWQNTAWRNGLRATYVMLSSSSVEVFGDIRLPATEGRKRKIPGLNN